MEIISDTAKVKGYIRPAHTEDKYDENFRLCQEAIREYTKLHKKGELPSPSTIKRNLTDQVDAWIAPRQGQRRKLSVRKRTNLINKVFCSHYGKTTLLAKFIDEKAKQMAYMHVTPVRTFKNICYVIETNRESELDSYILIQKHLIDRLWQRHHRDIGHNTLVKMLCWKLAAGHVTGVDNKDAFVGLQEGLLLGHRFLASDKQDGEAKSDLVVLSTFVANNMLSSKQKEIQASLIDLEKKSEHVFKKSYASME